MCLIRSLRDFFVYPVCHGCGAVLAGGERMLCCDCRAGIPAIAPHDPLFLRARERLSADGAIKGLVAAFLFEEGGLLQALIHELKYGGMHIVGEEMGREVGWMLSASLPAVSFDGIVPVPLHKVKERERGYNQSVYIARGIEEVTGIPVADKILARCRYTQSQTALNARERRRNVEGAFRVVSRRRQQVRGGTYLIVDDVITTGSTILSCAHALAAEGAGALYAGAVALARQNAKIPAKCAIS